MNLTMEFDVDCMLDPCFNGSSQHFGKMTSFKESFLPPDYDLELFESTIQISSTVSTTSDGWREDTSSDSGIDCIQTKTEPLSPSFFSASPPQFEAEGSTLVSDHITFDGKIEGFDYMLDNCYRGDEEELLSDNKTILLDDEMEVLLSQITQPAAFAEESISEFLCNEPLFPSDAPDMDDGIGAILPTPPPSTLVPTGSDPVGMQGNVSAGTPSQTPTTIIVIQPGTPLSTPARKGRDTAKLLYSKVQIQPKTVLEKKLTNGVPTCEGFTTNQNHAPSYQMPLVTSTQKLSFFIQSPTSYASANSNSGTSVVTNNGVTKGQIVSPMTSPSQLFPGDFESKAIKRQQRMIKNRESASLSRKRKKKKVPTATLR